MKQLLFQKKVSWIHDYEIRQLHDVDRFAIRHISGTPPLSKHQGILYLTNQELLLEAKDANLKIDLGEIVQIYLGFDNCYTAASVKNFGVFWQPIRLRYSRNAMLYLIVGYNGIYTANGKFFKLLKEVLA